jgi:hypothetical protein
MGDDDEQLAFADEVGRYFARTYAMPPITGSVAGWLLICDPPQQTATELSEGLRASRSAIGNAVAALEVLRLVRRSRTPGERAERIGLNPGVWMQGLDDVQEYAELSALARRGLEVLGDTPPARRARLLEAAAFADFLCERLPALGVEWRARRDELRASGELPDLDRAS